MRTLRNRYDGPEEDSGMDEEHDHVGIAVGIVTVDGVAKLGVGPYRPGWVNKWKEEAIIIHYG
jgi:hypothetical protein